jgi:hypothetical protein
MRIALFTEVFLPKIDGITNRLRHTLEVLVADGHEVLLFAPDNAVAGSPRCRSRATPACGPGCPIRALPSSSPASGPTWCTR